MSTPITHLRDVQQDSPDESPADSPTGPTTQRVSSMPNACRDVTITSENGLHARPAMSFVDAANHFGSVVQVTRLGDHPETVDGKSIMQMLTLAAVQGTKLRISAEGDDAHHAVERLVSLIENGFAED
jgi:phosphocarrier protein